MLKRIAQRTKTDCAICVIAMVMGQPYSYERVLTDSSRYPAETSDGKFVDWWRSYLAAEGFETEYRRFLDIYAIPKFAGSMSAILAMTIPHLKAVHVVAIDEIGIVDPANDSPDHAAIQDYLQSRLSDGVVFDDAFLAVWRPGAAKASQR
jgi:hypothetical protein